MIGTMEEIKMKNIGKESSQKRSKSLNAYLPKSKIICKFKLDKKCIIAFSVIFQRF
jgi:hypothetical protein